jgi:MerR family transcriptional regulator, light-induced transcriptional regulator
MAEDRHLRIGELSRRSGVSPELLRAWERRYGLLQPSRSSGGLRLYSSADLERVQRMRRHVAQGLAAREAAALAISTDAEDGVGTTAFDPAQARARLRGALEAFDEAGAQAVIDDLLAVATLDAVLSDVIVPYLRELGELWERNEVSIAQEHFATNVLRGRLLGLARGWGRGAGRRALLACPPGERHDLGLIAFGLALRERGWRIDYLGSDTPAQSIVDTARAVDAALVVVSAVTIDALAPLLPALARLPPRSVVAVGGAGAHGIDPQEHGVLVLNGDPVGEAERVGAIVSAA